MDILTPMTGADWDRALGLDRPEVRALIAEAAERLVFELRTQERFACTRHTECCEPAVAR